MPKELREHLDDRVDVARPLSERQLHRDEPIIANADDAVPLRPRLGPNREDAAVGACLDHAQPSK